MSPLECIKSAGFDLRVEAGRLVVSPFSKLTEGQLAWLRSHKAEILDTLRQTGRVMEAGQGGQDVPPANDPDQDRITVHVPSLRLANGRAVACDLTVPANRLTELEKALGIQRNTPAALPPELVHVALAVCKAYGDGEAAQAEMLADLAHYPSTQFPALIAHFRAKLEPIRCVDCTHAVIDAGIAQCRAEVKSGLPTRGYWYTDPHVCPWHFKSRDSPDAEK